MNEPERLRQGVVDDLEWLLQNRHEPNLQKFVDSLSDYVVYRLEHNDASRHDPGLF